MGGWSSSQGPGNSEEPTPRSNSENGSEGLDQTFQRYCHVSNRVVGRDHETAFRSHPNTLGSHEQQSSQPEGAAFRHMSIVASKEELLGPQAGRNLPVNQIANKYPSLHEYLGTHFRLLREDCMASFRDGIVAYQNAAKRSAYPSLDTKELSIYSDIRMRGHRCKDTGVEYLFQFHLPKDKNSKKIFERLIFGSLLCISPNQFDTFVWGVVAYRSKYDLKRGLVPVHVIKQCTGNTLAGLDTFLSSNQRFDVIESRAAYFLPYHHVLKGLQQADMDLLPFTRHLVDLEARVLPPSYLLSRQDGDKLDFSTGFPGVEQILGTKFINVLQADWPTGWSPSLDSVQINALKQGLTKQLTLIQGPPGTGKTFLGLLLVKILLASLKDSTRRKNEVSASPDDNSGPILVICYTNHALDQFLESIYINGETNLIRMGARSQSDILKNRIFSHRLKLNKRTLKAMEGQSYYQLSKDARKKKSVVACQIRACVMAIRSESVTPGSLTGIATPEQIDSLFSETHLQKYSAMKIVQLWLTAESSASLEWNGSVSLQDFVRLSNVWQLNLLQRKMLYRHWLKERKIKSEQRLRELIDKYEDACQDVRKLQRKIHLALLKTAAVVGMTTTAAAMNRDLLKGIRSEIVIIEEAAEVLEGHILACLNPGVKHLILIGDHLQLRPSVAAYQLSRWNKLDVSMFERLVEGGVDHVTLQEQRRMRPEISKLVKCLYPGSRDHKSVYEFDNVPGVTHNVFFFDHKAAEKKSDEDSATKVNPTEACLVVEFCVYLLKQAFYKPKDITILSMYTGQLLQITKLLEQKLESNDIPRRAIAGGNGKEESDLPRVSSVDNFQGEESEVIILSLVRSNEQVTREGIGNIGFLKVSNRICVALTRARKGLYIFGNGHLLAERSTFWKTVTDTLREDGALGPELELYCRNHPEIKTKISTLKDFQKVNNGGCTLACDYELVCGHACQQTCHPGSHDLMICPIICLKERSECGHVCGRICHGKGDCPPCESIVEKVLSCGQTAQMPCHHLQSPDIYVTEPCGEIQNLQGYQDRCKAKARTPSCRRCEHEAKLKACNPVLQEDSNCREKLKAGARGKAIKGRNPKHSSKLKNKLTVEAREKAVKGRKKSVV